MTLSQTLAETKAKNKIRMEDLRMKTQKTPEEWEEYHCLKQVLKKKHQSQEITKVNLGLVTKSDKDGTHTLDRKSKTSDSTANDTKTSDTKDRIYPEDNQQGKKDSSDSPNGNSLGTQSFTGEGIKSGQMPVKADSHPAELNKRIISVYEKGLKIGERNATSKFKEFLMNYRIGENKSIMDAFAEEFE